jgi:hypothetical protein
VKIAVMIVIGIGCFSILGIASIFLWVLISNAFFKGPNSPKIYWGSHQSEPFEIQDKSELRPCCSDNWRAYYPSQSSDEEHSEQRGNDSSLKVYGSIPAYRDNPKKEIVGFVTQSGDFNGCHLYQCTQCKQFWAYSEPDYAWRGYFTPVKNIEENRIKKTGLNIQR